MSEEDRGENGESPEKTVLADEGRLAEKKTSRGPFGIWIFVVPILILAAWPALKLFQKASADDIDLSGEDVSAFHYDEDGTRQGWTLPAVPKLGGRAMNMRYRSNSQQFTGEQTASGRITEDEGVPGEREAAKHRRHGRNSTGDRKAAVRQPPATGSRSSAAPAREDAPQTIASSYGRSAADSVRAREQQSVGYTKGFMTKIMKKAVNSPKAAGAVFNNRNIISGFMARKSVRSATGSLEGLTAYLKTEGPSKFINNRVVQAALGNQAVISAVASSGLVKAMFETPAAKELMRDPKALDTFITANPQLASMATKYPDAMKMLTGNPEVSRLIGRFDTIALNNKR